MLQKKAVRPALVATLLVTCFVTGCTRHEYRLAADREAYNLIAQKLCPEWLVPARSVDPSPDARFADFGSPDCPPIPPDDPAAACLMAHPYRFRGSKVYRKRARVPSIEYPSWREQLATDEEGITKFSRDDIMSLAFQHSRSYQTEYEQLYLTALGLSLERFAFDIQWAGGTGVFFDAVGNEAPPGFRNLTVPSDLGFTRRLAGGGQFLVDFANTFLWEFSGSQVSRASSSMLIQLTQPILRGAFREVQLESLTQAERDLLYAVRTFARFRREFYVDNMGDGGYLGLLSLAQAIRNQEKNLESLERNLLEHQALAAAGLVRAIQVDQVYQDYEQGRLSLLASSQTLEAALDRFKIQLGLPPDLDVAIDEEALEPFRLNDTRFDELEATNEVLRLSLLQFDRINAPDREFLDVSYATMIELTGELPALLETIRGELSEWESRLEDGESTDDPQELERRQLLAKDLGDYLDEAETKLQQDVSAINTQQANLGRVDPADAWTDLMTLVGENFRERLADLFVVQTQLRAYMISIDPVDMPEDQAMQIALNNRLDLMNARGRVVDSLRRVEVAADGLEADLDFVVETELRTDPNRTNAFRFDSSANRYRAGVRFDGPLNRLAERNTFRAAQIAYQRSRRDFMATHDAVAQQVRQDLRQLRFNRFSFEVTRRQLITAVRQVEEAQFGLRNSTVPNSSLTRDLLSALQQLLSAQNSLIRSWTAYETSRMNLFRDLGVMQVDGEGNWVNEFESFSPDTVEEGDVVAPDPDAFLEANQFDGPEPADLEGLEPVAPDPEFGGPELGGPELVQP